MVDFDEERIRYDEEEARAERVAELKKDIFEALKREGVSAYPWEIEGDIYVEGALTDIVKVYLEWRSEIDEELGNPPIGT
jgi:hypothetical protein